MGPPISVEQYMMDNLRSLDAARFKRMTAGPTRTVKELNGLEILTDRCDWEKHWNNKGSWRVDYVCFPSRLRHAVYSNA